MKDPRPGLGAALLLEMHAPIARIELLASQMRRDGATPRTRALAASISQAVAEIDRLVSRSLELWVPGGRQPEVELQPVLDALRERVAPTLATRGIGWRQIPLARPVRGDAETTRQAAIHLVREVVRRASAPVEIELTLLDEKARYGVALACAASPEPADAQPLSDELQGFALACGGALETRRERDRERIHFWLARETACDGC